MAGHLGQGARWAVLWGLAAPWLSRNLGRPRRLPGLNCSKSVLAAVPATNGITAASVSRGVIDQGRGWQAAATSSAAPSTGTAVARHVRVMMAPGNMLTAAHVAQWGSRQVPYQ